LVSSRHAARTSQTKSPERASLFFKEARAIG
jgi:hypothetical protein